MFCYTGSVVGPVSRPPSLTSRSAGVKQSKLIAPFKKTRIPEEIADRIRRGLLDRTFPAGRPLPSERLLAQQFGVSRGSVRDAFRILEVMGLLEMRHGQGTFPKELSVERLVTPLASVITRQRDLQDELMDVRRMFEPAVARVAADRRTDDDVAQLERVLAMQRRKVKARQNAIVEDTAFHAVLARATRNRVVERIMETLNDLLVESRKATLTQRGRPEVSLAGHEKIVSAIRRREPEAAAAAMRDHIDQIAHLFDARDARGSSEHRSVPISPR